MSRYYKATDVETVLVFSGLCDGKTCEEVKKVLNSIPAIDIVCCGECKYWEDFECQCDWASTDHEGGASYSLDRDADDFCSYGEREGE